MKFILIILILIILYFTFRGELFSDYYSYVKLYSDYTEGSQFAGYYSCDGKYLNHTFRKKLVMVNIKLLTANSVVKIYGYTDNGMCGDSPVYVYYATEYGQERKVNPLWKLLVNEHGICEKKINLSENYNCFHIELSF